MYQKLLYQAGFDRAKSEFLVNSFTHSFPLNYQGSKKVRLKSPNLKLTVGSEIDLWNKVMKEVKLLRFTGPYEDIPYEFYIQSQIGLVAKDGGKDTRLIFHLSYPWKNKMSVNANIPESCCSVHYPNFNRAVEMCLAQGIACNLGKSDMKSAFRNLGMKLADFCWLIFKAKNPIDHKWYYFIDKCLPFGSSISCAHFQLFSDSVACIVSFCTGKKLLNYLDDYLFAALQKLHCDQQIQVFIDICKEINFPISFEKTAWGCTMIVFLGLLINTITQTISIPCEKVDRAKFLIQKLLAGKKTMVKAIQQLCGFLNFLCRCIIPGRAFTQRLYSLTAGKTLLAHHHIRVNNETREDLHMWLNFIENQAIYSRPFMDMTGYRTAKEVNFYTDLSGNFSLRMGGVCRSSWMWQRWDTELLERIKPSIEFLELYAVTAGILAVVSVISKS